MSTGPHDDNNHSRNRGDDEKARMKEAAARLRVPVATLRYWRRHDILLRAERRRRPGHGESGR